MEPVLLIAVVGLAIALAAALVALRRRADELDALVDRAERDRSAGAAVPSGSMPAPVQPPTGPEPPGAGAAHATAATPATRDTPLELLPVGVLRVDADHRITEANERARELLAARGQLRDRSVMEAFLDARLEAALDAIPVGGIATLEHRAGGPDGAILVVRGQRIAPDDLVVVLEDVSELRRLQRIRTEFIDNLGHELRTPLSTVTLLAETLAREAEAAQVPARMRERIARLEVETGHIAQMVNEMLDLARIEGGTQLRLDDDVDLARLAAASAERLRLFAERSGVTLVTESEPDLPHLRGDEARLGQVVVNLVHNAVKFSPDGGEVRITTGRAGDSLELAVTDHGIGIRRADRARIFERFYKVDRARVRGGGTGLGLAIARHVVEGHGGHIAVDSLEGSGSTFTVTLPIAAAGGPRPGPEVPPWTA